MNTPQLKYFRPGQYIFKEGDPSRSMFLIKKGTVSVRKRKGGAWIELARIYTNEVVGELAFLDRHPRSAAAVAMTEVEASEIPYEALDPIYKQFPEYIKSIMASVAERLRKADDMIRKLQKETVVEGAIDPESEEPTEYQNTAAILAATADVDFGGKSGAKSANPGNADGSDEKSGKDSKKPK